MFYDLEIGIGWIKWIFMFIVWLMIKENERGLSENVGFIYIRKYGYVD